MFIVAKIHNDLLGRVMEVKDVEEGKKVIVSWAEAQLERALTDAEFEAIEENLEYYNEEDVDNIFCISFGIVE